MCYPTKQQTIQDQLRSDLLDWYKPAILILGMLRKEDREIEANLSSTEAPNLKKNTHNEDIFQV